VATNYADPYLDTHESPRRATPLQQKVLICLCSSPTVENNSGPSTTNKLAHFLKRGSRNPKKRLKVGDNKSEGEGVGGRGD